MDFWYKAMKFLILTTTDPHYNLAVEEYLFRNEPGDILMLWQNEPTVVIGKNQNAYVEVDLELLRARGIHLARRITGGGAVYHDLGNVNYTFISDAREQGMDFAHFTAPILSALSSLGINAALSGRNDLLVDGLKFSGNAQYSSNGRTLHHGTLLFDSDLAVLSSVLRPDEEKLRSKAIASVRSRVTNLAPLLPKRCQTGEFIALLADFIKREYAPELLAPPAGDEVDALYARNASEAWLLPHRAMLSTYTRTLRARFACGGVCITLEMEQERVRKATVTGDFFGTAPISELEQRFVGLAPSAFAEAFAAFDPELYIHGLSNQEFLSLLQQG
jgi:lipoate-protein ligase A